LVTLEQTLSAKAFLDPESQTLTREDLLSHSSSIADQVLNAGIRTVRCAAADFQGNIWARST
jgi:hypothetical protein